MELQKEVLAKIRSLQYPLPTYLKITFQSAYHWKEFIMTINILFQSFELTELWFYEINKISQTQQHNKKIWKIENQWKLFSLDRYKHYRMLSVKTTDHYIFFLKLHVSLNYKTQHQSYLHHLTGISNFKNPCEMCYSKAIMYRYM